MDTQIEPVPSSKLYYETIVNEMWRRHPETVVIVFDISVLEQPQVLYAEKCGAVTAHDLVAYARHEVVETFEKQREQLQWMARVDSLSSPEPAGIQVVEVEAEEDDGTALSAKHCRDAERLKRATWGELLKALEDSTPGAVVASLQREQSDDDEPSATIHCLGNPVAGMAGVAYAEAYLAPLAAEELYGKGARLRDYIKDITDRVNAILNHEDGSYAYEAVGSIALMESAMEDFALVSLK